MDGGGDVADPAHECEALQLGLHGEGQVDPGREVPAGTQEDDDPDVFGTPGPEQPRLQPVEHRSVDGIPLVGPVDREGHHAVGDIDQQCVVHPPNRSHPGSESESGPVLVPPPEAL